MYMPIEEKDSIELWGFFWIGINEFPFVWEISRYTDNKSLIHKPLNLSPAAPSSVSFPLHVIKPPQTSYNLLQMLNDDGPVLKSGLVSSASNPVGFMYENTI